MADLREVVAGALGVPVDRLFGRAGTPAEERDARRYYVIRQASFKKWRRKNRQFKTRIQRMVSMARRRENG